MVPPVHKVRSESRSAFSSLTRPPDSEARAKAVELNRKLDALDQRAEERKAAAGECFGGKAAEGYARTKQLIADQRKDTAEGVENTLARNDALEAERVAFERWRAENQNLLMRDLGDVKLEVVRIAKRDFFGRPAPNTAVTVEATNMTTNKILKPRNQRVWGYQHGSDVGGMYSVGAALRDSFGNEYKLTSISPPFLGDEAQGISPGQTVSFEVRFGDVPLQHAESVHLIVEPGTFGQASRVAFRLPSEAFYGTVANR
jgi:hypothetical protein